MDTEFWHGRKLSAGARSVDDRTKYWIPETDAVQGTVERLPGLNRAGAATENRTMVMMFCCEASKIVNQWHMKRPRFEMLEMKAKK
jgi:hypothetical protein